MASLMRKEHWHSFILIFLSELPQESAAPQNTWEEKIPGEQVGVKSLKEERKADWVHGVHSVLGKKRPHGN